MDNEGTELVEAYDYLFKFIVIGEAGTGKSCLLYQCIHEEFKENSAHTIGVEFSSRTLRIGDRNIKLQLWDTAGQERFRSVTRSYYRGAAGVILVYDITSRQSFANLAKWLADCRALASPHLVVVLVGNKLDKEEEREVEYAEGSRWAQENSLLFVEVSSLTGQNVMTPFLLASQTIISAIDAGTLDPDSVGTGVSYGERQLRAVGSQSRLSAFGGSTRRKRRKDSISISNMVGGNPIIMASTLSEPLGGAGNQATLSKPKTAPGGKEKVPLSTHLIAGGVAGLAESLACHPLDTIKVRMQLSRSRSVKGLKPLGFFATGRQIAARETPLGLYKGLGAVVSGIVPKMAIRFASFELYKGWLVKPDGSITQKATFLAGLCAGATEAVAVVTPMEVVKIRLQAQQHSLADPLDIPRYRNAAHAAFTIVREEGITTLYRGVSLTALRQATNQGVNFTAYQQFKKWALEFQPAHAESGQLPSWQTMILGLVSGAMGPFSNAPIDTIKTRIQKASKAEGETALSRMVKVTSEMFKNEGAKAFYKGITPRVLRVAPGQAIVFTVYERMKRLIDHAKGTGLGAEFDE
ncbi:uncharacterized protein L203_102012 [Cryptococcus depauperatus CBS 7841]|uniref:Solute carrier family 25 (Mitochondrial citrate transporter), member 1 n=1 Tax=Cryptococcus depauperatus CBS 7841 TaxID=1295531 RepID=A0AAJ8JR11_9TREE